MAIDRIAILSVPVSDQPASKAFYADVVGFDIVRDNPMGPGRRWVELAPPGGGTSITLVHWFDAMPPGSVQGVVLETDDIDADHATLSDRGLELSEIESAPWGRYATFSDPDGNGWVLQESGTRADGAPFFS